jgi:hypothetical protein
VDRYPVGQPIRLSTTVATITGVLANAGTLTLVVQKPDGTRQTYATPTNDATGLYHQDLPTTDLAQTGDYQYEWVATGANAGVASGAFLVYDPFANTWPNGTAVPWRPSRVQVAKYVPDRTVPADQLSDAPLGDFTAATTPTATQADGHIDDACSWVALQTGTLTAAMYPDASAVAAVRAAGMIELSFPVRDADINTGQALLAQADAMLTRLVDANEAASPGTAAPGILSAWAFPDPVVWGDRLDLW